MAIGLFRPSQFPDLIGSVATQYGAVPNGSGDRMRRREFVKVLAGGVVLAPFSAHAQQSYRIGVLMGYAENDAEARGWITTFEEGLKDRGYVIGSTIAIERRWSTGDVQKMHSNAAQLTALKPDAILVASSPALAAMRQRTNSIPIIFVNVADPVGQGFVTSLAHPDGNITGFTSLEYSMGGKWIELLKEIRPSLTTAAVLVHPATSPYFPFYQRTIEETANRAGVKTDTISINDPVEIERALSSIENASSTGVVVVPSAFMTVHRHTLITLMVQKRLPAIYSWSFFVRDGGLISYGIDAPYLFKQASGYVDQILKGAKPTNMPIQQPSKFELLINLKTAKQLGVEVPDRLQQIADEVIE